MNDRKDGAARPAGETSSPTPPPIAVPNRSPAARILVLALVALLLTCAAVATFQAARITDLEQHIERLQDEKKPAIPAEPPP